MNATLGIYLISFQPKPQLSQPFFFFLIQFSRAGLTYVEAMGRALKA